MKQTLFQIVFTLGILGCLASTVSAAQIKEKPIGSTTPTEIGQNAFTRAVQKPLENIVTPVANPHTPCNSVVECRKYGGDLKTVWQFNNATDYSPKDYPERCYVLGKDGKYVYSPAAC